MRILRHRKMSFCNILWYRYTCSKWYISSWVAEYSFCLFVLNKRRSDAEMCCFWNHPECSLLLLSVTAVRAQTSASVPFVSFKTQNKMHTNMSLPLIYNHWGKHLVLITKKAQKMWNAWQYLPHEYYSTCKLSAELKIITVLKNLF